MLRKKTWIAVGVLVLLLGTGVAYSPVSYERTVRDGTDEFGAHHALWGKRVKSVSDVAISPIRDVGLILVNLKRTPSLAPATVQVKNSVGSVVASKTVPLASSADDEFVWFQFDSVIIHPGEQYTVEVSAPEALSSSPVGVRFDADTKELALAVRERIPVWENIVRWTHKHPGRFASAWRMVVGGILLTGILAVLERIGRAHAKWGRVLALCFLAGITLYLRVPLSHSVDSAYGGDAFNYILKGNAWIKGADPFAADSRKAPLYSFLTAPGLLPALDPILWGRGVSIVASIGTVLLTSLFLIRLGAPLSMALGAGLLLAVNRDFQFESVQGLSNPLYAMLIMAAAYAYISQRRYWVSVYAALATLTRYEGAAAAGILLPSMWIARTGKVWSIVREAIPFIALVSIPFILTPITGNMGVRTFSDLTGDEGLYIAYSWEYFLPSIQAFKLFFGRLWILTPNVGDVFAAFGSGALFGIIGPWIYKRYVNIHAMLVVFPVFLIWLFVTKTLWGDGGEIKLFIALFSAFIGFGMAAAIYYKPRVLLPIVVMVLVQTAVITAILPKNRYYLQIIPFLAIAIAGGLWVVSGAKRASKMSRIASVLALCMIVLLVYDRAGEALSGQISDYNKKSAEQTVLVQAGRYLKGVSGTVAYSAAGSDIELRVYLPRERLYVLPSNTNDIAMQYAMLKEANVVFVVDTNKHRNFVALIEQYPDAFQKVETFTTRWSNANSTIYRVY